LFLVDCEVIKYYSGVLGSVKLHCFQAVNLLMPSSSW